MAESLRQALSLLGRSPESQLAESILTQASDPLSGELSDGLLNLLVLRRGLAQNGPREVVQAIDRFLEALRLQQFQSSQPEPAPGRSEWINLQLPLHLPPQDPTIRRVPQLS